MKCIYHAIKQYSTKGGYLWMRRSKFCRWIPHFGRSDGIVGGEHWQPDNPTKGWKVFFHMFFAKGRVKKGD